MSPGPAVSFAGASGAAALAVVFFVFTAQPPLLNDGAQYDLHFFRSQYPARQLSSLLGAQLLAAESATFDNVYNESCQKLVDCGAGMAGCTQGGQTYRPGDGDCSACRFGCPEQNTCAATPSYAAGACGTRTIDAQTAQAMLDARATTPRTTRDGRNAPLVPFGITNYAATTDPALFDQSAALAYFEGIFASAVIMIGLAAVGLAFSCGFCCFRCPCAAEHRSEDSPAVTRVKVFGLSSPFPGPCQPSNEDTIGLLAAKCCLAPCTCGCCCNPCSSACCCSGMLVTSETDLGHIQCFSGGLDAAGDKTYAEGDIARQEIYSCCGGTYPSVQFGNCGCGEWGCCCDCCCGGCELLNPCCRMNLFDFERSQSRVPGYSQMQSRAVSALFFVAIVVLAVATSIIHSGANSIECGVQGMVPAAIGALDDQLFSAINILGGLVQVSVQADIVSSVMTRQNVTGTGDATQTSNDAMIKVAYDLKTTICGSKDMFVQGGSYLKYALLGTIVVPSPLIVMGLLGLLLPEKLAKLSLIAGACCMLACLYIAVFYLVAEPLSLIVADICGLLGSVRRFGVTGLPGDPPNYCGVDGKFGSFITTGQGQVRDGYSKLCTSYAGLCSQTIVSPVQPSCCTDPSTACTVGSLAYEGGDTQCTSESTLSGAALKAKCCPKQAGAAECPSGVDLSQEQCANQPTNFSHHAAVLAKATLWNVRRACLAANSVVGSDELSEGKLAMAGASCKFNSFTAKNGTVGLCDLDTYTVDDSGVTRCGSMDGGLKQSSDLACPAYYKCFAAKSGEQVDVTVGSTAVVIKSQCAQPTASAVGTCSSTVSFVPASAATDSACSTEGQALDASWSEASGWTFGSGRCSYACTNAMILAGKCRRACTAVTGAVVQPVTCSVSNPSLKQCSTGPAAVGSSSADVVRPGCDDPDMRRQASSILASMDMVDMTNDMMFTGFNRAKHPDDCRHPAMCRAGSSLRALIDCEYVVSLARRAYQPLCLDIGSGLINVALALWLYYLSYASSFAILILGYKRWQTVYMEGREAVAASFTKFEREAQNGNDEQPGAVMMVFKSLAQNFTYCPAPLENITHHVFEDGPLGAVKVTKEQIYVDDFAKPPKVKKQQVAPLPAAAADAELEFNTVAPGHQ